MRYLLCSVLYFISTAALTATPAVIGSNSPETLSTTNLTQWIIGLVFILLLILVLAWLAKRFTGLSATHKGNLKILSGIPLGGREKAVLIKAGNQHLLLGVSPGRVVTLHTFAAGEIEQSIAQTDAGNNMFQENLQKVMNKNTTK